MSTVRTCSERIEVQRESLNTCKSDTMTIMDAFKKTQKIEANLKNSFLNVEDTNLDLISDILNEEVKFEVVNKKVDKNGNIKEPNVNMEDKKKLLATLKAIDNGDSIESVDNSPEHRQRNLIKKFFGDVSK
ncbi:hypothetical protein NQ317_002405 [Molorchus minor]|uniref:Uncharacterized protein n=1 Tax=Molorchus minor TaxID=1323400 RepID=A0ABQ9JM60_9CUCU|nr:hypothetical protein NQ317_002405 [Molorchus minor]